MGFVLVGGSEQRAQIYCEPLNMLCLSLQLYPTPISVFPPWILPPNINIVTLEEEISGRKFPKLSSPVWGPMIKFYDLII